MNIPKGYLNVDRLYKDLKIKHERYWISKGEKRALELFHQMATKVPAYKDFLSKHNINHKQIKTIADLKTIPTIDKNNYLRAYSREQLCWNGNFSSKQWIISTTSGSTGEPYYFPREKSQDMTYAIMAELYLLNNFDIKNRKTLYIDGFAMGAWIGGLFTYQAIQYVIERRNYQLSIITPGIFKKEIIKAVMNLGRDFDQIIIGGYPPLLKDTIDDGIDMGLDWKEYNIKFIFSAEGFSEDFRDYMITKTGLKNEYKDTLNHYGTVDLGTMAHETPLSILIRRLLKENKDLHKRLFQSDYKMPTLAQFNPELFFFEQKDSELVCSSYSGIPLIRYDLKDTGGIYTYDEMNIIFNEYGINLEQKAKEVGIYDTIWHLPFVYVFERRDFVVKFHGANIYPETIRTELTNHLLQSHFTGKFTMDVKHDDLHNQYLEINLELKQHIPNTKAIQERAQKLITSALLRENSEYRSNHKESADTQIPRIICWKYESPEYFTPGVKQKWVIK